MLVVDASVAIKWVVPEAGDAEPDTGAALALLEQGLMAPDLILAEFGNAMWKKVRQREFGPQQARDSLAVLPTIISLLPTAPYAERALEIAFLLDDPYYDCVYLAVAELHGCSFVTADQRLLARYRQKAVALPIVGLADYTV